MIANRSAIVTSKRQRVGVLAESGQGTRFLYDESCRVSIGCTLPAATREHYWREGLHPFFQNLGAEGWLRGVQARAGRTNDQDDFGFLLNFGADCIGAVGVEPLDRVEAILPLADDQFAAAATGARRTVSGVHKKLLAFRDGRQFRAAVHADDPASHIAKFNREDLPTFVWNEDISLRLARDLLGADAVTRAEIGTLNGIEGNALLVERFDRDGDNRLRLEDLAQILSKPRGQDFGGKYLSSYEEAAQAVVTYSARPRIDLDRFFRLVIFNCVIGNADAHLKNFSLLERPEGLRLSPAYDLINSCVYAAQFDTETALEIDGRKRPLDTIDRHVLEKLAADIGLPAAAANRALEELGKRLARSKVLKLPIFAAPDDFRERYGDIVRAHARRILV